MLQIFSATKSTHLYERMTKFDQTQTSSQSQNQTNITTGILQLYKRKFPTKMHTRVAANRKLGPKKWQGITVGREHFYSVQSGTQIVRATISADEVWSGPN